MRRRSSSNNSSLDTCDRVLALAGAVALALFAVPVGVGTANAAPTVSVQLRVPPLGRAVLRETHQPPDQRVRHQRRCLALTASIDSRV